MSFFALLIVAAFADIIQPFYTAYQKIMALNFTGWLKIIGTAALSWALAFIAPIQHFVLLAIALVVVDFVSGTKAARKRGDIITSAGYKRTVSKLLLYTAVIMLAEGMRVVFFSEGFIPITYIAAGFICATEFRSVLENVGAVTGTDVSEVLRGVFDKLLKPKEKQDTENLN
jgi:phage-related holin